MDDVQHAITIHQKLEDAIYGIPLCREHSDFQEWIGSHIIVDASQEVFALATCFHSGHPYTLDLDTEEERFGGPVRDEIAKPLCYALRHAYALDVPGVRGHAADALARAKARMKKGPRMNDLGVLMAAFDLKKRDAIRLLGKNAQETRLMEGIASYLVYSTPCAIDYASKIRNAIKTTFVDLKDAAECLRQIDDRESPEMTPAAERFWNAYNARHGV